MSQKYLEFIYQINRQECILSFYHADCDDNVEKFTEEEVEGVFIELVVNLFNKKVQELDKLLLMVINHPV